MCDDQTIRDAATQLARRYEVLDVMKMNPPVIRRSHITRVPKNSQPPGNARLVETDVDCTTELRHLVQELSEYVPPSHHVGTDGVSMCRWIAFNAPLISDTPLVERVGGVLRGQVEKLTRCLEISGGHEPASVHDHEQLADMWGSASELAVLATHITGWPITNVQITSWCRSPRFSCRLRADGVREYRFAEVMRHISQKTCGDV